MDGKLALSGANYFKNFNERIIKLIKNEHITSFKLDGMGNASSHIKGSSFASDFDASIALLHNMRSATPNLFINLTTGTDASPSGCSTLILSGVREMTSTCMVPVRRCSSG